jgi:RNA polymerase sigma factor (sigma-70 family)
VELPPSITPVADPIFSVASAAISRSRKVEERTAVDARELLVSNLALIDRAADFACRRNRLSPDEAEEFKSVVRLKMVENDYAILRKYEGRSSLAAYLSVVVQRMLLDYRIHMWGKWHPSAEAKRLGDVAVELEKLTQRDGRTIDEALPILSQQDSGVTRESLERIAERLPQRAAKNRLVDLEHAEGVAADQQAPRLESEQHRLSQRVSKSVQEFLTRIDPDDRLVLQLRFDGGMSIADIARSMHLDQKALYRRVEHRLRELRKALDDQGCTADEVADLIGDRGVVLDFRLGEPEGQTWKGARP